MTWALAKVCKVFALAVSLRNSLKLLKGISSGKKCITEAGYGVLMFWAIFGFFVLFEQYFEILVRWIPTYYYVKSFFIVLMAYPQLRFTNYIFQNVVVYIIEYLHNSFGDYTSLSVADIVLLAPIKIALLFFPVHIVKEPSRNKMSSNDLNGSIDANNDDEDLSINLFECFDDDEDNGIKVHEAERVASSMYSTSESVLAASSAPCTPPRTEERAAAKPVEQGEGDQFISPMLLSESLSVSRDKGRSSAMYRRGSSIVMDGVRGVSRPQSAVCSIAIMTYFTDLNRRLAHQTARECI
jgi:hypothetical protein